MRICAFDFTKQIESKVNRVCTELKKAVSNNRKTAEKCIHTQERFDITATAN